MKSVNTNYPRGRAVRFTRDRLEVELADGRIISTPLDWYPRLLRATVAEREAWEWFGDGVAISWESLDEDLSIQGMLDGNPARGYAPAREAV